MNLGASSDSDDKDRPDQPLEEYSPLPEEPFLVVEHDQADRIFKSPRPSVTLSEMQRSEVKKDLSRYDDACESQTLWLEHNYETPPGDSSDGIGTQDDMMVRGGGAQNNHWDELWMEQELDVGAEPFIFDQSTAEAQNVWEEAALMKHDDEEWHDLEDAEVEMSNTNTMKRFEEVGRWDDEEDLMCSESEGWSEKSMDDE